MSQAAVGNGGGAAHGHDVIVVGASAGGVDAVRQLAAALPADLPAAVFVTVHVPPNAVSVLPAILTRAGALPAAHAEDGEPVVPGRIYVAPPDRHLLVRPGVVRLERGPRENGSRPAVDPLFRSAARAYGPRVIAVVLSGMLDDGTAGLAVVRALGGVTVVQDPADAQYPAMPANALAANEVHHVVALEALGPLLARLAAEPAAPAPPAPAEPLEGAERTYPTPGGVLRPDGDASGLSCPECSGALWEEEREGVARWRCRVGHAYAAESLLEGQAVELERAVWAAVRVLEERAELLRRVRRRLEPGALRSAARMEDDARDAETQAGVLRAFLLNPALAAGRGNDA